METNLFLQAVQQYGAYTENGALSHATTGAALVDYFAKAATYRKRSLEAVFADMGMIWAESPLIALRMVLYLRLISRKTRGLFASTQVQRGQGNRDEARKCLHWLAKYQSAHLYANLWLLPIVGAWKDLWHADLIEVLDREKVYALIREGLNDDYNRALIAKYLPKIRSRAQVYNPRHSQLNDFAYGLCRFLGWTQREYRQFKASGTAHAFQQTMSANLWDKLDFARISGKALFQLVNRRGKDGKTTLERHDLESRFQTWLQSQPVAKFTGYVYELYQAVKSKMSATQRMTVDKQFNGLVSLAKEGTGGIQGNVWCALDTSGSMQSPVVGKITAYDICISLGVYFASLNEGAFHNQVIMFDATSRVLQLKGDSFTDRIRKIQQTRTAWGSTNFQSVIEEIIRIRREFPHIPLADYPTTLLVVSDMQFNPVKGNTQTNYEAAMKQLSAVGLPNMRIVWWFVTGRAADFPSTIADEGVVMIGGFDGSIVPLLLGGAQSTIDKTTGTERPLNAYENMLKALHQEVLQQIRMA